VLVAAQMLLLAGLALTGPLLPGNTPGQVLITAGLILGGWAVWSMRGSRWRIHPDPHPASTLVAHGPYRWVRHPMYTAVLLVAASWMAARWTPARGVMGLALIAVLVMKLRREEVRWSARDPAYAAYRERTWRILPGLY
jgi:protein-S-isoprenylcysteine O-methyltransferase Ste14